LRITITEARAEPRLEATNASECQDRWLWAPSLK